MRRHGLKLPEHVTVCVKAIVNKDSNGSDLRQQLGEHTTTCTQVKGPASSQSLRYEPTYERSIAVHDRRKVNAVEPAPGVGVKGREDVNSGTTICDPSLYNDIGSKCPAEDIQRMPEQLFRTIPDTERRIARGVSLLVGEPAVRCGKSRLFKNCRYVSIQGVRHEWP